MNAYRKYISADTDMQTMLFRYSILTDVFNARLPEDLKCEQQLSDELKKKILRQEYSEQNDRLLLLYGFGVIDDAALKNLVLHNKADYLSDVIMLEERVRTYEDMETTDKLSYNTLQNILILCANSKKYDDISSIGFEQAEKLMSYHHIKADNGFIRCDKELLLFLNDIGEKIGFYNETDDDLYIEKADYIASVAEDDYDINSEKAPILTDYIALECYLSVYDELFGKEFIKYALDNNIPFDNNFLAEYRRYLNDIKLTFEFKAYLKKRDICGDKVNYYDYAHNTVENNELVHSELNADSEYSATVHLSVGESCSDEELMEKAMHKYRNSHQLIDKTVIEIIHADKTELYVFTDNDFISLDKEMFRRQLFDFNKIWSIIQLCSRSGKLRRINEKIEIPMEYLEEIASDEREYAERMICDQYRRMVSNRKNNKLIQSLNDLKATAASNMADIAAQKATAAAAKAAKRASRNPNVILNKPEDGGTT